VSPVFFFLKTFLFRKTLLAFGEGAVEWRTKLMLLKLLQKEYILINWATHQACLFVFNV